MRMSGGYIQNHEERQHDARRLNLVTAAELSAFAIIHLQPYSLGVISRLRYYLWCSEHITCLERSCILVIGF